MCSPLSSRIKEKTAGFFGPPAGFLTPSLACLNTHDMLLFAAFWKNLAEGDRKKLTPFLKRWRFFQGEAEEALRALLLYMAASPASMVLINLEDLWLEEDPQNVPGRVDLPNWRRKARLYLEDIMACEYINAVAEEKKKIKKAEEFQPFPLPRYAIIKEPPGTAKMITPGD
ncbi:MAG TPA: hypothetical protein ENM97_01295 [Moorella mulderi]|nr:hypothetical protein [Moorella mulderi]